MKEHMGVIFHTSGEDAVAEALKGTSIRKRIRHYWHDAQSHKPARNATDDSCSQNLHSPYTTLMSGIAERPAQRGNLQSSVCFYYEMAESEGFEPSVPVTQYGSLANCWFQPLTHDSEQQQTAGYREGNPPLQPAVSGRFRCIPVRGGPFRLRGRHCADLPPPETSAGSSPAPDQAHGRHPTPSPVP